MQVVFLRIFGGKGAIRLAENGQESGIGLSRWGLISW